jgi:proteasome lid subunit RPN8/RPN11
VLQPFTKIVVDKKEEEKFRRRALDHYPFEHIEALWGRVRGDVLYICAFMAMEHKVTIKTIHYSDQELDDHEDDARDAGMEFLGTIHTHPDCADNRFGDTDLEMSQDSQECVMGICAIETKVKDEKTKKVKKLKRRRIRIAYWPTVRPLEVVRKDWDASSSDIKRPRKAGKVLRAAASKANKKRGSQRRSKSQRSRR